MSKPDINPSNYMRTKYSAALASYLGKANLSAANICDKIDGYILKNTAIRFETASAASPAPTKQPIYSESPYTQQPEKIVSAGKATHLS